MERGIESLLPICYPFFMSQTATIQDVLETINLFATHVDEKFARTDKRFDDVDRQFKELSGEIAELKVKVADIDKRLHWVEENMVTKEYLDKKLDELRADLTLMAQRLNTKLSVLIEELVEQKVLTIDIARRILALEPFPQG